MEVGGDYVISCHETAACAAVFRALRDLGWEGQVEEAKTFVRRLAGFIALPATVDAGRIRILVFPCCRSVHTWFMRIPLDIAFVDASGRVLSRHDGVMPWRLLSYTGAAFVIERPSALSAPPPRAPVRETFLAKAKKLA